MPAKGAELEIRRADTADADAVAETFTASFAGLTFLPKLHTPEEDRAFFAGLVADEEVWIAVHEGRVLGLAALTDDMLSHLYVHPDVQGGGIGGDLLDVVKERRPSGFRFWVFQQNEGARRFYERHGCRLVRLTDGSGNEERTPDALYEWRPAGGGSA